MRTEELKGKEEKGITLTALADASSLQGPTW